MASTVLAELLGLHEAQPADLAMALWGSLSETQRDQSLPIEPELVTEIDRRLTEHIADPGSAIPWSEVQRKLRG